MEIIVLSCYVPLYSLKNIISKLSNYKSENILFNNLINMQIKEPLREKKLVNSIKSLGKISDAVSKKVRDQYEKHPYPRWRYFYSNIPANFLTIINALVRPNKIEINNKFDNPNVLIAGCGTGKQILVANNYLNANILAVDLSLTSLAYAKRKIEELNLKNIEFLHADILQLKNLNKKFDIIECAGVLHHMRDPLEGLKALLELLDPHGLLRLGLYSELARQDIIEVREFIKNKKFMNTINDIRKCRKAIIENKENRLLRKVLYRKDFYSTSTARDLMFHIQEHRFTLKQISKISKNFNLEFLGFVGQSLKNKFSIIFSNDKNNVSLDNWDQFEKNNPDAFIGMYDFLVRKIK
jgi:ubiquinone/menaquinone biosynthesis C-methylase UbiE